MFEIALMSIPSIPQQLVTIVVDTDNIVLIPLTDDITQLPLAERQAKLLGRASQELTNFMEGLFGSGHDVPPCVVCLWL